MHLLVNNQIENIGCMTILLFETKIKFLNFEISLGGVDVDMVAKQQRDCRIVQLSSKSK